MIVVRFAHLILGAYALLTSKTNFKMSKKIGKNIQIYISAFYVLMDSFMKKNILWARTKIKRVKKSLILVSNFVIFT
jgi:hypothetical protein